MILNQQDYHFKRMESSLSLGNLLKPYNQHFCTPGLKIQSTWLPVYFIKKKAETTLVQMFGSN